MMHERRFEGEIERLRSPQRVERLEVNRVVNFCLRGTLVKSILDIGVGSALFAQEFARRGLVVAGVDANVEMVEAAKSFAPQGDFRQAVAEELPYEDDTYDLAFMGLVLHETDDGIQALSEAHRVARKRVAVLEWPYEEEEFGPPLDHRLCADDVTRMAQAAGFSQVNTENLAHTVLYLLEK